MKKQTILTELEKQVLEAIITSDYQADRENPVGHSVWYIDQYDVDMTKGQVQGAIASCVKKGYVVTDTTSKKLKEHTIFITQEGFDVYNSIIKPKATKATASVAKIGKTKVAVIKKNQPIKEISWEFVLENPEVKAVNCKNLEDVEIGKSILTSYLKNHQEPKPNKQVHILLHWLNKREEYYKNGGKYVPKTVPTPRVKKAVEVSKPAKGVSKQVNKSEISVAMDNVNKIVDEGVARLEQKQRKASELTGLKSMKTILKLVEEPTGNAHLKGRPEFYHTVGDKYLFIEESGNRNQYVLVERLKDKKNFTLGKEYFANMVASK